jgi:hypothetical protein
MCPPPALDRVDLKECDMYVIREVLHCKPGEVRPLRLLTDVTGEPFWTVIAEAKVPGGERPARNLSRRK